MDMENVDFLAGRNSFETTRVQLHCSHFSAARVTANNTKEHHFATRVWIVISDVFLRSEYESVTKFDNTSHNFEKNGIKETKNDDFKDFQNIIASAVSFFT